MNRKNEETLLFKEKFFKYTLLSVSFIALSFFLVSSLLVNSYFEKNAKDVLENELRLTTKILEDHIENQILILNDIASVPIVVSSLMQFDKDNVRFKDFLESTRVLGKEGEFSIYSFDKEILFGKKKNIGKWFDDLLENKISFNVSFSSENDDEYITIALPILFNGYPEGIIIFTTKFSKEVLDVVKDRDSSFILRSNDLSIVWGDIPQSSFYSKSVRSKKYSLSYEMFFSTARFEKNKYIFFSIFFVFIVGIGLLFSIFFYRRGRIYFIDPHLEMMKLNDEFMNLNSLYESIFESTSFGIIATEVEGTITRFNKAAERMLGYKASEVVGINSPAILHKPSEVLKRAEELSLEYGEEIEPGFEVFIKKSREGIAEEHHWTYVRKNSSEFTVRLSVTALRNLKNEIVGFLGVFEDVTEVLAAKESEKKALEEIKRTSEIKSEFLANMSHEIRTPMNGVIGMTEILEDTNLSKEQYDIVETIKSCGKSLLYLINDILDFSKIEANKIQIEQITFNLNIVIEEIHRTFLPATLKKELKFIVDNKVDKNSNFIGDEFRIRQVLMNLIGNALKFTSEGSITISVFEKEGNVHFQIIDTGIGIEKKAQEKLFLSFTQEDTTTTRKYGGSGLGLSISRSLCRLMNGEVSVKSISGKGSTFEFYIPLEKDLSQKELGSKDGVHEEIDSNVSVLLVEDNPINAKVAGAQLAKLNISYEWAINGEEALKKIETNHYDIILMDIQMPEMDGIECTTLIRENKIIKQPYIIALTANAFKEDRDKCLAVGMNDYLSKPFTRSSLMNSLIKYRIFKKS